MLTIEAEAMKLATCWVAGFFRRKVVESLFRIGNNERVMAVTPIGYATKRLSLEEKIMTGFGLTHKRKKLSGLVAGLDEPEWPEWIKVSLESARLAPSAVNRQPNTDFSPRAKPTQLSFISLMPSSDTPMSEDLLPCPLFK